ncbi:MAG TPA: hypothetical protein VNX68_15755, partial [Nitrosopumilaceae archaeon]|nr:hypothetical protein [Nitrosopumilaceae archaeon]
EICNCGVTDSRVKDTGSSTVAGYKGWENLPPPFFIAIRGAFKGAYTQIASRLKIPSSLSLLSLIS